MSALENGLEQIRCPRYHLNWMSDHNWDTIEWCSTNIMSKFQSFRPMKCSWGGIYMQGRQNHGFGSLGLKHSYARLNIKIGPTRIDPQQIIFSLMKSLYTEKDDLDIEMGPCKCGTVSMLQISTCHLGPYPDQNLLLAASDQFVYRSDSHVYITSLLAGGVRTSWYVRQCEVCPEWETNQNNALNHDIRSGVGFHESNIRKYRSTYLCCCWYR